VLSPSGRAAAVVELRRQRVALLSADDRFSRVAASFEPLPISLDGGDESPDVITGCCWGAAAGDGAAERLLVACQSSCVYLLNR